MIKLMCVKPGGFCLTKEKEYEAESEDQSYYYGIVSDYGVYHKYDGFLKSRFVVIKDCDYCKERHCNTCNVKQVKEK